MRYRDTGTMDPEHALASWLERNVTAGISELRIQSGYFRVNALGAISAALQYAAERDLKTHFVFGANDGDTLHSDVVLLMSRMGIPRSRAKLSIVSYANALFHPKVYHVTRADGTKAAFVGSANFTSAGLTGGNVEAAITVDTADGDPVALLDEISNAVDKWVEGPSISGAKLLQRIADADALLDMGILAAARPPRPSRSGVRNGEGSPSPNRQKLVVLPAWPKEEEEQEDDVEAPLGARQINVDTDAIVMPAPAGEYIVENTNVDTEPTPGPATIPLEVAIAPPTTAGTESRLVMPQATINRAGFPDYILFARDARAPTTGWDVLSGYLLPEGSAGLILKLNKDNGRHFQGSKGTANISIPTAAVKTFRFGLYGGDYDRPRAEFRLRLRYYSERLVIDGRIANSNLMPYGFLQGERGHGDVRMLMPAAVKGIAEEVRVQGGYIPEEGDIYLLEWPSGDDETFGITFLAPDNKFADTARDIYNRALGDNTLVGGAAWLPPGIAPSWR